MSHASHRRPILLSKAFSETSGAHTSDVVATQPHLRSEGASGTEADQAFYEHLLTGAALADGLCKSKDSFIITLTPAHFGATAHGVQHQGTKLLATEGLFKTWNPNLFMESLGQLQMVFATSEPYFLYQQDFLSRCILEQCPEQEFKDIPTLIFLPIFFRQQPGAFIAVLAPQSTTFQTSLKHQLQAVLKQTQALIDATEMRQQLNVLKIQLQQTKTISDEIQLFYQQFSQNISQCFWICDIGLDRTLFTSGNVTSVLGVARAKLLKGPQSIFDLVAPQDRDRVRAEFHTNLNYSLDTEFRIITDTGEIRWIWLRLFPFAAENETGEESAQVVFIADDVTDRKQMDEAVVSRQKNLASQNKASALEQIAEGVAHELNNPLFVITGRVFELRTELNKATPDKSRVDDHLFRIEHTTTRIGEVLKSLKSLARPLDLNEQRPVVNLETVFKDAAALFSEKAKLKSLDLKIQYPTSNIQLKMDQAQISQMILNLFENAASAIENLPQKWIELDWTEDTDSVYIYVTDSGAGVPIHMRGKIFEPFFTTKPPGQSAGLGLTFCQSIANRHGGTVSLDTMQLHTRFVVQLPKRA